jgi:hypothetical protein
MADLAHATRVPSFVSNARPLAAAMGVLGAGIGFTIPADAASIVVNNLSGTSVGGQCTLRDAIQAANTDLAVQGCAAGSGADVITFAVTGTILLASQINIYSNITITGPGAANLTITPSGGSNRSLFISSGTVAITDTTFANANTDTAGGQIELKGTIGSTALTLTNDVFNNNINGQRGGALFLYNGGAINITNCTFTGNQAGSRGGAAKLYHVGPVTISNSTFTGNSAGPSGGRGGAMHIYKSTNVTITQSTISGNTADRGGGLFFYKTTGVTVSQSTISGNTGGFAGGAIQFYKTYGSTTISDSTISGNTTNSGVAYGAAVWLYTSAVTITNSTINGNSTSGPNSGGIGVHDGSTLNLVSSIVANSTGGNTFDLARFGGAASTINADHSLVKSPGVGVINGTSTANIFGLDPNLGPLANNGGPTLTFALNPGSPAIDTGSNPGALATDQRGGAFARTVGAGTDIGAFEVQGAAPPPTITSVPALAPTGLAALSALLGGLGAATLRRRKKKLDS